MCVLTCAVAVYNQPTITHQRDEDADYVANGAEEELQEKPKRKSSKRRKVDASDGPPPAESDNVDTNDRFNGGAGLPGMPNVVISISNLKSRLGVRW